MPFSGLAPDWNINTKEQKYGCPVELEMLGNQDKKKADSFLNPRISMVAGIGLEPMTFRL